MIRANEGIVFGGNDDEDYYCFFSNQKQTFDLRDYLYRLVSLSNCSAAAFILMFEYIKRIQEECKELSITDMNCHRLILSCLLLAIKYIDDDVFIINFYADIGGIPVEELKSLEVRMLDILDWTLGISTCNFALSERQLGVPAGPST